MLSAGIDWTCFTWRGSSEDSRGEENLAPKQIFGPLPPANLNSLSSVSNASQQELPATLDAAGLRNGDADHSFSVPNLRRRLTESRQDARSAIGQRPRRGERAPSSKDGRARPTGTVLGPVRPAKVSKVSPSGKGSGPRQVMNPSELPSDAQPPLSELDLPKPPPAPASVPLRRSRRLQGIRPEAFTDPAAVASTDSVDRLFTVFCILWGEMLYCHGYRLRASLRCLVSIGVVYPRLGHHGNADKAQNTAKQCRRDKSGLNEAAVPSLMFLAISWISAWWSQRNKDCGGARTVRRAVGRTTRSLPSI
ncbi:uncharacterized protein F4812DRAFT_463900 [Daldinia caldariorum]|uniref:uncharacterized protein n=1 Tax=Daldinia caldariorum TaxID=326644 RepID=UPI00200768D4|nr:uncharacterized protein F4812DRAFT_463900 [Daldinia caldariorum]KAI1463208.1 hypothetical protein F4812DRAFT_463900 [Daldinia caldariorum]